jgi:hypothetical protein
MRRGGRVPEIEARVTLPATVILVHATAGGRCRKYERWIRYDNGGSIVMRRTSCGRRFRRCRDDGDEADQARGECNYLEPIRYRERSRSIHGRPLRSVTAGR